MVCYCILKFILNESFALPCVTEPSLPLSPLVPTFTSCCCFSRHVGSPVPDIYAQSTKVLVTRFDDVPYAKYAATVDKLREAGIVSSVYVGTKKFGKQIDYAVKENYTHVVILGATEVVQGTVKIKDLATHEEKTIEYYELANFFKKRK